MGSVYLAQHSVMGWPAAIKVLRRSLADDKVLVRRFINEARVIRAVRHPNIVEILDVGILPPPEDRPYLVMELLEGETLGQRLGSCGRLSVEFAIEITCQTALALAEAHDKGITHRDLKPENLFLLSDPDDPSRLKVKVLDFGIAKLRARHGDGRTPSAHTRSGMLLGTPAYMSPEQCQGIIDAVDHRADIYALSVILYQMLAGKVPFESAGTGDVLIMHISTEVPSVVQENPAVPAFVEAAIRRGMAKSPGQRFQSMTELAAALRSAEGRPEPASASSDVRSPQRLPRRVVAVGLSAVVAVALVLLTSSVRTGRERAAVPPERSPQPAPPLPAAAATAPASPTVVPPATATVADPEPALRRDDGRAAGATAAPVRKAGRRPRAVAPIPAGAPASTPAAPAVPAAPRRTRKAKPWL